jgi:lysyl-tRNA synthetase class 2
MTEESRIEKLEKLRGMGINPYPYAYSQKNHANEIVEDYAAFEGKTVGVAGRALRLRRMGKLYFIDLVDITGKIQVMALSGVTDENSLNLIEIMDAGDIIGVSGGVTKTKRGEISIEAKTLSMLAKSLRTLPEKFHGLSDTETRYRKRYLDFMVNHDARKFFITRAKILKYVRDFLDGRDYLEFETPILQPTYGGANAKPFITHHNALESDFYLRVADELYLKRLIIGGFEKVYEVSKDFRNEDIDSTHNPEFTQVELYEAYKDYNYYMGLAEELINGLVVKLFSSEKIPYLEYEIDFKKPFKRVRWVDELKKKTGIDISELSDDEAQEITRSEHLDIAMKNAYHVADALFDKYIKPDLINPTFVIDFPSYMCPLAKDKRDNVKLSERFEIFIAGREAGNSYSELTDPIEQRKKFEAQDKERRMGDSEVPPFDEDFLESIEYGMPPTAGLGLSIDRLTMILTNNSSIKEVIAFPSVKPERRKEKE